MVLTSKSEKSSSLTLTPSPQKVDEEIMKGLKLAANDDLDLEAHDKYFETIFESERMKQTYIVAAKKCHQEVTAKLPAIISKYEAEPFNIKKEMCNIKFMAVTTCVQVQAHLVSGSVVANKSFFIIFSIQTCPKEFVVDRPECSESKAWMEQCSPNVYSFTEMAMNLKAA